MFRLIKDRFKEVQDSRPMYLIAGLGNPGREHRNNRHNVGHMLLDRLAEQLGEQFTRVESNALVTKTDFEGNRLVLAKPQTFMNNSGQAVGSLLRYYKIPFENLMVVNDDVDLDLGSLRIRKSGGSAGQKGLASIIDRLGTQDFPRMRLGIGRPPGRMDAAAYVLRDFSEVELPLLDEVLSYGVDAVLLFVSQGVEAAMNRYNRIVIGE
ncbi:MAG: aminoacyl-tRNA hydrolase [Chloroflexota bacterium]|nr:aminoacyl-tRNA hydrolase [Chloroflexota bacterium]